MVFAACGMPTESSPTALVGRVIDPQGIPARGVRVASIEMSDVTDADGAFSVRIKEPNRYVQLVYGGARYTRAYDPADDGLVVDVRLPALHDAELVCDLPHACAYEASWRVGPSLVAEVSGTCASGEAVGLRAVPDAAPTVSCDGGSGPSADAEVAVRVDGRRYVLAPPPAVVRVHVQSEADVPGGCAVGVGDSLARAVGEGFYAAEASGTVVVSATCGDRPAVPKTVRVAGPTTVQLEWTAAGPWLDLAPWLPSADRVSVVSLGEGDLGWSLTVSRGTDGRFALPPLQRGRYAVYAGDALPLPVDHVDLAPERLRIDLVRATADGPVTGLAGALVLDRDLLDGALRVEVASSG